MRWILITLFWGSSAIADPIAVHSTARDIFERLPDIEMTQDMRDVCGSGRSTNPHIGYCTTENVIYFSPNFTTRPSAGYEMAHVLGHAVQVRHGVADIAFRAIQSRPQEEAALRGMVTRQVECIAGVLTARAGVPSRDLLSLFSSEPFIDAHWGRRPLNAGPKVSIGLDARAESYQIGFEAADFSACSVGEISADLIVQAAR